MSAYPSTQLYINGRWRQGSNDDLPVVNPASGEVIGRVSNAGAPDLDEALSAAAAGFEQWRRISAFDRAKLMRESAEILRQRSAAISRIMTLEQGKPLAESKAESAAAADIIDWFAEEARRAYGRLIPPRATNVRQMVIKEPVGPVAAFSPWNFPLNQAVRRSRPPLQPGCSIILMGPRRRPRAAPNWFAPLPMRVLPAGRSSTSFSEFPPIIFQSS